jgi:hypothetical protein
MKNHVYRPLIVVIGLVAFILAARAYFVPEDFGTHETGYRFGWHRKSNENEWKQMSAHYKGREYCRGCHLANYEKASKSPHAIINCENCHGPAIKHPEEPPKLSIERRREQCLRCHSKLPYKGSGREMLLGIDNEEHNPEMECVMCHNPHSPGFN